MNTYEILGIIEMPSFPVVFQMQQQAAEGGSGGGNQPPTVGQIFPRGLG